MKIYFANFSLEDMKMKKTCCLCDRTDGRKYGQTQIQLWKHFNLSKLQFSGLMDGQWMGGIGKEVGYSDLPTNSCITKNFISTLNVSSRCPFIIEELLVGK